MAAITQFEFAKTCDDPLARGLIETQYQEEPVYGLVPFNTIAGLAYPYNQEVALPGVSFRNINEAWTPTAGVVNRLIEALKPFGGESDTDTVLVDAYGEGKRTTRDQRFAKAMAVKYVQTMLYNNSGIRNPAYNDVKAFDGVEARITAGQTVDGAGTGASDGSSVFAFRMGDGYCTGIQTPAGFTAKNLGEVDVGPWLRTRIQHVAGFAIEHGRAVGWIKDLRAAGQMLTTVMMDELQDKIVGTPSFYVMSKRSRRQLKTSAHTLGVALGVQMSELGFPVTTWGGVPIYVSDAILDTEVMP